MKHSGSITKTLAIKFAEILENLPDEILFESVKTVEQKEEWFAKRLENKIIGQCFKARFCEEDDPIEPWKSTDPIAYELAWRTVDYYETLWGVVQLSFSDLSGLFDKLKHRFDKHRFDFNSAWDLFIEIVSIDENCEYIQYLQADYIFYDLTSDNKTFALAAKEVRANLTGSGSLTKEQQAKLEARRQKQKQFKNGLKDLVLSFCEDLSRGRGKNTVLADKLEQHRLVEAKAFEFMEKVYLDAGKKRNNVEIRTEHWIDGVRYVRPDNRRSKT